MPASRFIPRGWPVAVAVGLLALLLTPTAAFGHAAFLDSQPEPGQRLGSGPAEITLEFTEPLNRGLSKATVVNLDSGETVSAEVAGGGEKELVLRPEARLGRAPYRVDWQTVSTVDGHTLAGAFSFGVKTAAVGVEHDLEQSPLARDGWLRIAARALLYASLFFFAGGVLTAALLTRAGREPASWMLPDSATEEVDAGERAPRLWRRTVNAGWIAACAAALVAMVEGADAAGSLSLSGLGDFLLSNTAGLARVGTVAALVVGVLLAAARMRITAAAAVVLAFLTIALSGHANSADLRGLAVLTDWIHLVAGAIWVGGIAQLAWAWLPALWRRSTRVRMAVMGSVLGRFGRLALPAFLVVAASGSINALTQLGHLEALWETAYGRVLAIKIALVALIALASYGHALRLRPALLAANPHPPRRSEQRHWRLLGVEPWLGLGAIVVVAALVAFPLPPQQLGESDEAAAAACDPCPQPEALNRELAAAEQAGSSIAAFWLRRQGNELSGTLRLLDYNERPVEAEAELEGAVEPEPCGQGCWRFTLPDPGAELTATITDGGRDHEVTVPSRWASARSQRARELLRQAEAAMLGLRTVRMQESLTSGIGGVIVRTEYRFEAPDHMFYRTNTGTTVDAIGKTAYQSLNGGPVRKTRFGADGFQLDQFFSWTPYARTVRWLGTSAGVIRIALFDRATPLWYRLDIDRETKRIVRERMITGGHFMTRSYFAFDRPLRFPSR
ncbi:MAG: copper resistance CopC/CopD family protein [Thermoanaerobaculia bacterium]